jgi:hypothetical protein
MVTIDKDHTNDNVQSFLSIFYCHMIHMGTSLILSCWSRCTVVSIAVDIRVCARGWSLISLLSWAPISVVPILTTAIAWSHNTRILCIVVPLRWQRCRARSVEVGALNLSLRSLKSLTHSLHSRLSHLLNRAEIRSLRGRTNTEPCAATLRSSMLHLPFSFHDSSSVFQD